MFGEDEVAISLLQSHFELFHKDFLPFGITDYEALTLIDKEKKATRARVLRNAFRSKPKRISYIQRKGFRRTVKKMTVAVPT